MLVLLSAVPLIAQEEARNAVYFELGGSAIFASLNYEHRLRGQWWGRGGASMIEGESSTDTDTTFIVPLTVSHVGNPWSNHHLELGGGLTFAFGDEQDLFDFDEEDEEFTNVLLTGLVGYRYQKPEGGFQFRTGLMPMVGEDIFMPWFGVSFGYAW